MAVFGDSGTVHGGGSGGVVAPYIISAYEGIYTYFNGPLPPRPTNCTYFNNTDFYQVRNAASFSRYYVH